jgi:hypothetical protein
MAMIARAYLSVVVLLATPNIQARSIDDFINAVRSGNATLVRSTIQQEPGFPDLLHYDTPVLIHAVKAHKLSTVKALVDAGADINVMDDQRRTPLIWSVIHQRRDIFEYLLSKVVVNVDIEDIRGSTALTESEKLLDKSYYRALLKKSQSGSRDDQSPLQPYVPFAVGAIGGLLLPVLEWVESRRRPTWKRFLPVLVVMPALSALLVWVAIASKAELSPLASLQIGIAGPAIVRAWAKKPISFV